MAACFTDVQRENFPYSLNYERGVTRLLEPVEIAPKIHHAFDTESKFIKGIQLNLHFMKSDRLSRVRIFKTGTQINKLRYSSKAGPKIPPTFPRLSKPRYGNTPSTFQLDTMLPSNDRWFWLPLGLIVTGIVLCCLSGKVALFAGAFFLGSGVALAVERARLICAGRCVQKFFSSFHWASVNNSKVNVTKSFP